MFDRFKRKTKASQVKVEIIEDNMRRSIHFVEPDATGFINLGSKDNEAKYRYDPTIDGTVGYDANGKLTVCYWKNDPAPIPIWKPSKNPSREELAQYQNTQFLTLSKGVKMRTAVDVQRAFRRQIASDLTAAASMSDRDKKLTIIMIASIVAAAASIFNVMGMLG